jgi:mono/diheme cytochrome c family protein
MVCHGIDGRGGVPVMWGTKLPADIRYAALTEQDPRAHVKGAEEEAHPPYTDALIEQAITQGLNPASKPLDWTMPRWEMTKEDVNDLIAYLKTLQ